MTAQLTTRPLDTDMLCLARAVLDMPQNKRAIRARHIVQSAVDSWAKHKAGNGQAMPIMHFAMKYADGLSLDLRKPDHLHAMQVAVDALMGLAVAASMQVAA